MSTDMENSVSKFNGNSKKKIGPGRRELKESRDKAT